MTYLMAGEGRRQFGVTTPSELPNKFAMSVRTPVGVNGFITPWNFPMAIPSWKIMPALICGNTVVIKPAEDLSLIHIYFMNLPSASVPRSCLMTPPTLRSRIKYLNKSASAESSRGRCPPILPHICLRVVRGFL